MASTQFLHLLEQVHKQSNAGKLPWRPARFSYGADGAFRVALGEGVIRVEAESEDGFQFESFYRACLLTREGTLVDEIHAAQFESDHFSMLRDIYQSARAAAFDLDRLVDGMQDDLEAGRTRELPSEESFDDLMLNDEVDEFPF